MAILLATLDLSSAEILRYYAYALVSARCLSPHVDHHERPPWRRHTLCAWALVLLPGSSGNLALTCRRVEACESVLDRFVAHPGHLLGYSWYGLPALPFSATQII